MPSLTVIVPVFNEERTVEELLRRLLQVATTQASGGRKPIGDSRSSGGREPPGATPEWQILIVNDGSTDRTAEILNTWTTHHSPLAPNSSSLRVFHHPANRGKGAAVRTALAHATGDVVVIQDADLEYDPADLPALLEPFRDPAVQAVYGTRYGPAALWRAAGREPPAFRPWTKFRLAVSLLNGLVWLLYRRRLHDEATCYKAVRRELLQELDLRSERFELCAEITGKLCRRGIPIVERPISYHPRDYGEGKKIGLGAFLRCVCALCRWRVVPLHPIRGERGAHANSCDNEVNVPARDVASRRLVTRTLAVCALVLIAVTLFGSRISFLSRPVTPRPVESGLDIVTSSLDFGQAWESDRFPWTIEFQNTTGEAIRIEQFDTSCDCAKVTVDHLEIPAGEKRSVNAILDLTRHRPAYGATTWTEHYPLRVLWKLGDGPEHRSAWVIRGRVDGLLAMEPGALWFGDDMIRGTRGQPKTLKIRPLVLISDVLIAARPEGFACSLERRGRDYELTVVPSAQLPAGFVSRELRLTLIGAQDRRLPAQTVTIFGTVNEKVAALPEILNLGIVPTGERRAATVVVCSRLAQSIEVTEVTAPAGIAHVSWQATASEWRVRLELAVTALGNRTGVVTIRVRLRTGEVVQLPVVVNWCGI